MANGTLTIAVPDYSMLKQVGAAITCWAGGAAGANVRKITTTSVAGPVTTAFVIPEALWSIGALALKRAGANIVSGLVAGSHTTYFAGNGLAMDTNANTCPARTDEPTITSITPTGLSVSMVYANVVAAGTVDIAWGDGDTTLGAAEAGTEVHVYDNHGVFTITISDVSVPANAASSTIVI
jgi:hypothetical protein